MDICKYCKKYNIHGIIERLCLLLYHIKTFFLALLFVIFKERLLLNIFVVIIFLVSYNFWHLHSKNLVDGALLAIIITANLERSANLYKENILWDGKWDIFYCEKRNFEHKRGVYISLYTELSHIIAMISNERKELHWGKIITFKDFHKIVTEIWGYTIPINIEPDFNKLDVDIAYNRFTHFCHSFKNIDNSILSLQTLLNHLNTYCPNFNVKSTVAILLHELYNTKRYVMDLNQFISESSVYDDENKWIRRLSLLRNNQEINTGALDNNINNIIISLYIVYEAINEDFNIEKS